MTRLRRYVDGLRDGRIDAGARASVVSRTDAVTVLDAGNGLGPPALCRAVDMAARTAWQRGVGVVAVRRSNHVGPIGWFVDRAAGHGVFAVVCSNTAAMVAPTNAAEPFLGSNPIAYAVPASDGPVSFDAATSVVPRGRVEQSVQDGATIPSGWATGPDGRPAVIPAEVLAGLDASTGHALVPVGGDSEHGGHKGFGLGLLVELLCGPLAGATWSRRPGVTPEDAGQFVLCLDPAAFGRPADIRGRVDRLRAQLRTVRPMRGRGPVRAPGDRRRECVARRERCGVPLAPPVVRDLRALADSLDISCIRQIPDSAAADPVKG